MNVRDDQKLVEIWLTNAEKIDPVLREGLKEIYAKYKTKKYMVAVFESGKGDLFLISLKAGGQGLNLTAADYVIHLDPWWNPAVESQATDRTHRIGQTRQVFSYKLICQNTVEEKILKLQDAKRNVAEAIIPGQETWKSLTREDLEMLFDA